MNVRNLGVIFDSKMTMAENVNNVTRTCFYQLRQLRFIQRCLPMNTVQMRLHAFISSKVDYCNSVLYGATSGVLRKLQAVLNAAARLFSGLKRFDHINDNEVSKWRSDAYFWLCFYAVFSSCICILPG